MVLHYLQQHPYGIFVQNIKTEEESVNSEERFNFVSRVAEIIESMGITHPATTIWTFIFV